jgi:hypothetical protein
MTTTQNTNEKRAALYHALDTLADAIRALDPDVAATLACDESDAIAAVLDESGHPDEAASLRGAHAIGEEYHIPDAHDELRRELIAEYHADHTHDLVAVRRWLPSGRPGQVQYWECNTIGCTFREYPAVTPHREDTNRF